MTQAPDQTVRKARKTKPAVRKKTTAKKAVASAAKASPAKKKASPAKKVVKAAAPKAVPTGYSTATPVLTVRGAATAADFYSRVFGAKELDRVYAADGETIIKLAMKIGKSVVHMCDEMPAWGLLSPASTGAATTTIQLYLEDVDAVWEKAAAEAIAVILPLEDTYWGERFGKFVDPFGHVWAVAKVTEKLTSEDIRKRFEALVAAPVAVEEAASAETSAIPVVDIDVNLASENEAATAAYQA